MAKLHMRAKADVKNIVNILKNEIPNCGLSCELVESVERTIAGNTTYLLVFEKYYMRNSNVASLVVLIASDDETVYVDAIGTGAAQGFLFKITWGAEEELVGEVTKVLSRHGFC